MDNGACSYRRFLDGDDQGIVEVIQNYKDGLILFLNSYVRNILVAEELAEETFFRLVVKKPKYSDRYSFKTWLYTIGRNRAINYIHFSSRFTDAPPEDYVYLKQEELSLEQAYIKKEEKIHLHHAIEKLPPQYGEVLYLAYFEALSIQDISHIMKKNQKQIHNLLYRAKIALRAQLDKEGFVYEGL